MARAGTAHQPARSGSTGHGAGSLVDGSLIDELGRRVRAASAELPVPEVRAASQRIGQASLRLGQVLEASGSPRAVPTLRAAGEHLDIAAGALLRAQDALAEYLQVIGLPTGPTGFAGGGPRPDHARDWPPPDPDRPRRDRPRRDRTKRGRTTGGGGAGVRDLDEDEELEPLEHDRPEKGDPGEPVDELGEGAEERDGTDDGAGETPMGAG